MNTWIDSNSTLDISNNTRSVHEFCMYERKFSVNSPILHSYHPQPMELFTEKYKTGKIIYDQALLSTYVYLGTDSTDYSKVAIKQIKKSRMDKNFFHEMARNELAVHYSLSDTKCNNIVKAKNYFEDDSSYFLVMECSPEPNFFEDMLENTYNPISDERTLQSYALDVLHGLTVIHSHNVIHCDLKPQNFLIFYNDNENVCSNQAESDYSDNVSVNSCDSNSFVKISDFGFSHIIPYGETKAYMKFKTGTFSYTAPEITNECYVDKSVDIWSFGLSLYQMAVAYMPTAIKQYKYGTGPIPFRKIDWKNFDFENLKNLIESCMEYDPLKRISAEEALNHIWFDTY